MLLSLLSNRTKLTYAVELHEDDEPRERLPLGSEHLPCEALIARDGRSGLGLHALLHLGSCAKRKREEFTTRHTGVVKEQQTFLRCRL